MSSRRACTAGRAPSTETSRSTASASQQTRVLQEIHVQMEYAQHALADTSSTTDRAISSGGLQALVFVLMSQVLQALFALLVDLSLLRILRPALQRLPALHVMAWTGLFSAMHVD